MANRTFLLHGAAFEAASSAVTGEVVMPSRGQHSSDLHLAVTLGRDPFIVSWEPDMPRSMVTCSRPPRIQMQAQVTLEPPFFQLSCVLCW